MWNLNGKTWYSEEEYNKAVSREVMITEGTYVTPDGTEYKLGKNLKLKDGHIIGLIDNSQPAYYMLICNGGILIEKVIYEKVGEFDKLSTYLDYIGKGSEE